MQKGTFWSSVSSFEEFPGILHTSVEDSSTCKGGWEKFNRAYYTPDMEDFIYKEKGETRYCKAVSGLSLTLPLNIVMPTFRSVIHMVLLLVESHYNYLFTFAYVLVFLTVHVKSYVFLV